MSINITTIVEEVREALINEQEAKGKDKQQVEEISAALIKLAEEGLYINGTDFQYKDSIFEVIIVQKDYSLRNFWDAQQKVKNEVNEIVKERNKKYNNGI